ncbi:bifunctional hydroxymethylpyrimidine kinase/phosphomethylpyrimidine kinase [Piscinibacter sp.]|uniref:bifunctional hydroxymethylpyrimidine kinase/phosphomethylpyrimidine kinase n=1 Tax=Piscinibacter sp. TaxID=1903157 RepID=UPI002F40AB3B
MNVSRPVVWSIAGSDSGGGAGLQADLKAFEAIDVHGCTAVAAITAQNSVSVQRVEPVATDLLDAQLAALASDLPPQAIKTGLLGSVANIRCVAGWVDRLRRDSPLALVVDPVWRASTGADLSSESLREALLRELLPRASVITPNRAEAAWLLGWDPQALADAATVERAAAALRALGPQAVIVTGGDAGGGRSNDWLDTPEARGWLSLPRVDSAHNHGSGCVFASSLAAALALGFCAADAAVVAKMSTTQALREGAAAGQGAGAVRPMRGFGLQPELLPALHTDAEFSSQAFAPLSQRSLGLYAVVDSADWVERVLAGGVRTVQLRIKQGTPERLSQEVLRSVRAAREVDAQLFINDHWELALEHGAYGVHLGQEDLLTADLGALRHAGLRLGLSTHSYWEVCRAHAWAPSYIACGPIYATVTKEMPWWPQGPDNLAYWCRLLREPVVAIAGMDLQRSQEAVRCGAAGVAVLRGIVQASDPAQALQDLWAGINEAAWAVPLPAPRLARTTYRGPVPPAWQRG